MMQYIRRHLAVKLFLSYVLVLLVAIITTAVFLNLTVPNAFFRHLDPNRQIMGEAMRSGMQKILVGNFRAAVFDAFSLAVVAAILAAILISLWMSRVIAEPVKEIAKASRRIAEGHYSDRVKAGLNQPEEELDEVSSLGLHFNQMAESLEHTETMRRQLMADVSHELRTPLTAIRGTAEGLVDGVIPPDEDTFQTILQESERMQRLVDDLQELSRVEAGQYQLQMTDFSLSDLFKKVEKRFSVQVKEKQVNLFLPDVGDWKVYADESRIDQVLQNLVGNALKYSSTGGNIWITATRKETNTCISVRDDGTGIDPEQLERIFTRFYRVDTSRSRESGGSGIGLTIAKHWVEAHGGKIWAESKGLGEGSTFLFTIPDKK
jgi:histidine kinase